MESYYGLYCKFKPVVKFYKSERKSNLLSDGVYDYILSVTDFGSSNLFTESSILSLKLLYV